MVLLQDDTTVETFPLERPMSPLRRRAAFDFTPSLPYFVAGEENRLVALACRGELEIFSLGNPILIVGPVGCGKTAIATHLAALASTGGSGKPTGASLGTLPTDQHREGSPNEDAADHKKHEPGKVVAYSAVDFSRSYAEAISSDDLRPLSEELNQADVLVIDDLHLIADKPAAQEELALRIEARYDAGLPTILTCKRMPSEVRGIQSRLASRTAPGLTIPISLPENASRRQLLAELALQFGLQIESGLIAILDAKLEPSISVRAMEAAMKQISLWCRMHDSGVTAEAIQQAIDRTKPSRDLSVNEITTAVARYFRLRSAELRSSSRKQNLVRARSLAMWLARQLTSTSMSRIGEAFGGRDHTTVLHAIRKTSLLLESDGVLKRAADELTEKLS